MKEIKITAPEGFEIDQKKSDLSKGTVNFKEIKKKVLSYEDLSKMLFKDEYFYYTDDSGGILGKNNYSRSFVEHSNNSRTVEQLQSILALNQLCNVAKYLNGDWLPNFNFIGNNFYIFIDVADGLSVMFLNLSREGNVFFKTQKLALQAIEILGEETIRKALTLNH